jgi:hypothetical protein|tara:strand:+ start:2880 stop:3167 length:288 start_codon:yes stop_codon:yes gene_type:complete
MPNWKKLIVSGSDATLNSLEVIHASGSFSGSYQGDGSNLTGISTGNAVGYSNLITLAANYTTAADSYNSLYGPLTIGSGIDVTITAGSFLKIEDF